VFKSQRIDRDEWQQHEGSSPSRPIGEQEHHQTSGLMRVEQHDYSEGHNSEGQNERQSGSDAVSDKPEQHLAYRVKAKREAKNKRCNTGPAPDLHEIKARIGMRGANLSSKKPAATLPGMVPSVITLASEETQAWLHANCLIRAGKNTPGVATVPPNINARSANSTATITQARRSCLSIGAISTNPKALHSAKLKLHSSVSPHRWFALPTKMPGTN